MNRCQFAPSLMCMDFLDMRNQLEILNRRADLLHVDIMDGHYCKNITLSPDLIKTFARVAALSMDVHLMTTDPTDWIELVAKAGARYISLQAETINSYAFRAFNLVKALGCLQGLVVNPATPLSWCRHYLNRIDLLTIMTVDVGFAGQPFIPEMLDKIREAAQLREKYGYRYKIQIDGSCNERTFRALQGAGADVMIVGSSGLFSLDPDLDRAYDKMLAIYDRAMEGPVASV